jgi:hypothetical protein
MGSGRSFAEETKANLDEKLEPTGYRDDTSSIFENVVAVQKKARVKAKKFLFSTYGSLDFSDSPYTMYGLNFDVGYATSESYEFYLNYTPAFITNQRSIAQQVSKLTLANGQAAQIPTEKAANMIGFEVLWSPVYGKESWGPYGIVRSDTFVDMGYGVVTYQTSTGNRFKLGIGKTYFLAPNWNLRMTAATSYVEMITSGSKQGTIVGLLEMGLVYYF